VAGRSGTVTLAGGGGGSAFMIPGRKKLAGDTLREADTPPHPTTASASAGTITSRQCFKFNLTRFSI